MLRDEQGEVVAILSQVADVTALNEAMASLAKSKLVAEEANQAKSEFLANMSHEIRTPLNGILGMLQLMKTTPLSNEQKTYADTAIQSSTRLTTLLSDILDLSRVEAGRLELANEPFDLREVVQAMSQLYAPAAKQKHLGLDLVVDPDIPKILSGDATRLQQVLSNLIGNAIKFTETGGLSMHAQLMPPSGDTARVLFTIADTGMGIPDHLLGKLFETFTQAEGHFSRRFQGAGLGLAIAKRLVDLMGGAMAVDSEIDRGTVFFVTIPFAKSEAVRAETQSAPRFEVRTGLKLLLAEDDKVNQFAMSKILERMGHHVHVVEDGLQALAELARQQFDCVIMDVQMPAMSGVEATKAIRRGEAGEANAGIPVLAMTAHAMVGDKESFLGAGMNGYIAKPVTADELELLLAELTARPGDDPSRT